MSGLPDVTITFRGTLFYIQMRQNYSFLASNTRGGFGAETKILNQSLTPSVRNLPEGQ